MDTIEKAKLPSEMLSDLVPLNVTLQGALGEGRVMSLVMSVHPGIEDDATINAKLDRMTGLMDRQKLIASIPDIEAEIALNESRIRTYEEQIEIAAENHDRQIFDLETAYKAAVQQQQDVYLRLESEWNDNDGRRPFDPRHPKVAKDLQGPTGEVVQIKDALEKKREEIKQGRADYTANIAKHVAEIGRLKQKLADTHAKIT